jgi:hypothetical protein
MIRRPGAAAAVLLLLLAGPLGLLELEHDHLHAHAGEDADHPDCPVCFAAKEPVTLELPSVSPTPAEEDRPLLAASPDRPEPAVLVRSAPPRGPPALS